MSFSITFDQFKASLLNKSINKLLVLIVLINYTDSKVLNGIVYKCNKSFLFQINADLWVFLFKES